MKKILLFGAPVFQIPIIQKAKEMGLYVGVIDINPKAAAVCFADEYFCSSLRDKERLLQIAKEFNPNGIVIGACDTSVVSAAYVCQQLKIPGHSIDTAVCATNKLKMLEAFSRFGVPHPKYQLVSREEAEAFTIKIPYPAVSKPINGSGSRGIAFISDASKLKEALCRSFSAAPDGKILIEEYMAGPEVSVEVLVVGRTPHVIQITDKQTSGPPYFFETGHIQPSSLPESVKKQIIQVAERAVVAVGIENSPAHVEIKVTESGPKLVELGARFGGGCISTYLIDTSVSGLCYTEAAIQMALGQTPDCSHYHDSGVTAYVQFILPRQGTICGINGEDVARSLDGIIAVKVYGSIGQKYEVTTENSDRIGYVVSRGSDARQAQEICEQALRCINIQYS